MPIKFDTKELTDLMKNFYILTGIRIALFDEKYNEIFSYPAECPPFCMYMRQNPDFYRLCCESDKISFETCAKTGSLTMYKCHAGLIEVTSPIVNNGSIIGYIMFGHVGDSKDQEEFRNGLKKLCESYNIQENMDEPIRKVRFKTEKQLIAASKILEAGIRVAREKFHADKIALHAEAYARSLYEKMGFYQSGEEFLEDNIPFIPMQLDLALEIAC